MHMTYPSLIYGFSYFIKHMQYYVMTVYHAGDIYIYIYIYNMHMIYKLTVIVQQYGLPEILPILNRVDVISRDL